jgi:hypothetical protein
MVFLNINTKNYEEKDENGMTKIDKLNNIIANNKSKVFILYYMEGCGPCNATRPEWDKIKNVLKRFRLNNDVAIVDIDQVLSSKIKKVPLPNSFPTMRLITNGGKKIVNYEDSSISNKDRTIDSFVKWINHETKNNYSNYNNTKRNRNKHISLTKNKKGGKWSKKYKRSIDCKNPKGFSQKQYCKYGRK